MCAGQLWICLWCVVISSSQCFPLSHIHNDNIFGIGMIGDSQQLSCLNFHKHHFMYLCRCSNATKCIVKHNVTLYWQWVYSMSFWSLIVNFFCTGKWVGVSFQECMSCQRQRRSMHCGAFQIQISFIVWLIQTSCYIMWFCMFFLIQTWIMEAHAGKNSLP